MEIINVGLLVSGIIGIITLIFDRLLNRALDKKFKKIDEEAKRKEEKDYLIIKGLIMLSDHQVMTIKALKRAKIDKDNNIISINGELEAIEKNIEEYQNTWEDYLINNQER